MDIYQSPSFFRDKTLLVVTPVYPDKQNRFIGGIFVQGQVQELSKYFKEIVVISPVLSSLNLSQSDKNCKDYAEDNIRVFFPRVYYIPWAVYRRFGISRIHIDNRYKVVEYLIQEKNISFDLIHAHFAWPSAYIGKRLKEKYNVPCVVTAHGYDAYELPFRDPIWRRRIETALSGVDHIITVSESNLEYLKKLNITTPVSVIPNGFRNDLFYPRDTEECRQVLDLPLDKKIILTVGNLVEVKGHRFLIEAVERIATKREDVICVIVGSGHLKHKLEEQVGAAGLNGVVQLVGGRPHTEIPLWMNACDIFALPSLRESFGIVQVEAMACGKPVVATRNGGSEEIIHINRNGLLCDAHNPRQLAETLGTALNMRWDKNEIEKHVKNYSEEGLIKQVLEIYEGISQLP